MHEFAYRDGKLHCERVALDLLARRYGTPLYVYSARTLEGSFRRLDEALAPLDRLICYAMKANSNRAILRTFADLGSGFDTVSAGEIQRAVAAGGDPGAMVFAGVAKTEDEIRHALEQGIHCFNVESVPELDRIDKVARRLKTIAPVSLRVNPNVDAHTHAKITTGTYENKFGIAFEEIEGLYDAMTKRRHVTARGLSMHIGSQLTSVEPFEKAARKVAPLAARLKERHGIEFLSVGGGVGIVYDLALESGAPSWWKSAAGRKVMDAAAYAKALVPIVKPLGLKILFEPGRSFVGNAGALVTRVEYVKKTGRKNFVIVDAGMNDLIRPALYDAFHQIVPVKETKAKRVASDVVGPVCETGDAFCKDRLLPPVQEGDYLALLSAGAYGFVMASTYNTRPLPAEAMVRGGRHAVTRARQSMTDVWDGETLPPWMG